MAIIFFLVPILIFCFIVSLIYTNLKAIHGPIVKKSVLVFLVAFYIFSMIYWFNYQTNELKEITYNYFGYMQLSLFFIVPTLLYWGIVGTFLLLTKGFSNNILIYINEKNKIEENEFDKTTDLINYSIRDNELKIQRQKDEILECINNLKNSKELHKDSIKECEFTINANESYIKRLLQENKEMKESQQRDPIYQKIKIIKDQISLIQNSMLKDLEEFQQIKYSSYYEKELHHKSNNEKYHLTLNSKKEEIKILNSKINDIRLNKDPDSLNKIKELESKFLQINTL